MTDSPMAISAAAISRRSASRRAGVDSARPRSTTLIAASSGQHHASEVIGTALWQKISALQSSPLEVVPITPNASRLITAPHRDCGQ